MTWTTHPVTRIVALVASVVVVLVNADDRGGWFWLGFALVAYNGTTLAVWWWRRGMPAPPSRPVPAPSHVPVPVPSVEAEPDDVLLLDLADRPAVARELARGPALWIQVSYLDLDIGPVEPADIAACVYLTRDGDTWEIGLDDDVKPYLDLDAEEDDDPAVLLLRADGDVMDAWHEDRETYRFTASRPLPLERAAVLAVRALVAHHEHVASHRA